ncbi:MAG: Trp family transcriptional regulator [Candidatus Curtissbacteria bacterium]
MTRISRRILGKQIENEIFETLWEAISQVRTKQDVQLFLNDLLTPSEKLMIAKRLSIAVLLLKNRTYGEICDLLKVSNETVSRIALVLKMNTGFMIGINKVVKTEAGKQFWQDIENLLYRMSSPGKAFLPEEVVKHKLGHKKKNIV